MSPVPVDADPRGVLAQLRMHQLIAVIRSSSEAEALRVGHGLVEAGAQVIEVTYTTPGASAVIRSLKSELDSTFLVGAGTIRSAEEPRSAADAGADFLMSAGGRPSLVEAMQSTGLLVVPGVFTPTEIMTARSMDVLAVKLFPASLLGPGGLQTLRGPFPDLPMIATGGIAADEVGAWLDAGALAVGMGAEKYLAGHRGDGP